MQTLKIYIDRLKAEHTLKLDERLPPAFLQVEEKELAFQEAVRVQGEVYLADDHLVAHLDVNTVATLPCSICNQPVSASISMHNLYLTKPLSEVQGAIFDLTEEIREAILLQTPLFTECSQGKCPEREEIKQFLKKEKDSASTGQAVNFPFAGLD